MQPYLLPYIGYYQLLACVDRFVVFDDVNFISRGWINRNRILLNGQPYLFTLPLAGASQNRLICEIELHESTARWREKFMRTVRQAYGAAPQYAAVAPVLERVLWASERGLSAYLCRSLREVSGYLDLGCEIVESSRCYGNAQLKGQQRILDICRQEAAGCYVNLPGGAALYSPEAFAEQQIELRFLQPREQAYSQGGPDHIPWLSIIDVLMFNSVSEVRRLLNEFTLH